MENGNVLPNNGVLENNHYAVPGNDLAPVHLPVEVGDMQPPQSPGPLGMIEQMHIPLGGARQLGPGVNWAKPSTEPRRQLGAGYNWAPTPTGRRCPVGPGSNWAPGPTGPCKLCFPAQHEAKFAL